MRKKSREATRPSVAKALQIGDRGHLNSAVFITEVVLKIGIFLRELVGMGSGSGRTERLRRFWILPPGGRAIKRGRSKNGRLGRFQGSLTLPRGLRGDQRLLGVAAGPLRSRWACPSDICPPQVYATSVQARLLDICPPQVYASSV